MAPEKLVGAGRIIIVKVRGIENLPDVGTKCKFLGKAALEKCREVLGLARIDALGTGVAAVLTTMEPVHLCATTPMILVTETSVGDHAQARAQQSGDMQQSSRGRSYA